MNYQESDSRKWGHFGQVKSYFRERAVVGIGLQRNYSHSIVPGGLLVMS
jgi:hypothetical protein